MKLDPLAQMHLMLREHGWEPTDDGDAWDWDHPTCNVAFHTVTGEVICWEVRRDETEPPRQYTVAELRRRLKELAPPT